MRETDLLNRTELMIIRAADRLAHEGSANISASRLPGRSSDRRAIDR